MASQRDVAVGKHADKMIVVADRQRADVQGLHSLGRLFERRLGSRAFSVSRHDVTDLHGNLLDQGFEGIQVGFAFTRDP
jgi:hypothetical protein